METIVNKLSESGIITLDLTQFLPEIDAIRSIDMKDYLFMGMILKENDFRNTLDVLDLTPFKNKFIYIYCSADAIIPSWAYMLWAKHLYKTCTKVYVGSEAQALAQWACQAMQKHDWSQYEGKRLVIKGCGDRAIPEALYTEVGLCTLPYVKSLMFGEPCSTVPIYKAPKI